MFNGYQHFSLNYFLEIAQVANILPFFVDLISQQQHVHLYKGYGRKGQ